MEDLREVSLGVPCPLGTPSPGCARPRSLTRCGAGARNDSRSFNRCDRGSRGPTPAMPPWSGHGPDRVFAPRAHHQINLPSLPFFLCPSDGPTKSPSGASTRSARATAAAPRPRCLQGLVSDPIASSHRALITKSTSLAPRLPVPIRRRHKEPLRHDHQFCARERRRTSVRLFDRVSVR